MSAFESALQIAGSRNGIVPDSASVFDWNDIGESEHFVQFYEEDFYLVESVSTWMAAGLRAGEAAVIIAAASHREAVERELERQGIDLDAARASGQYLALDARATLDKFMVGDRPDERLFNQVVGAVVASATSGGRKLRAFGEMVALLWEQGKPNAAIELEKHWNELARKRSFALFCAYPMCDFKGEKHGQPFLHVCKEHSRVIPAESYSRKGTKDERLRAISELQQKAGSLEMEVSQRKTAQKTLARREQELADLLENATEAIHQVGPDGRIIWANRAELEMLGYTADEYIGHPIAEFHADPEVIADIFARLKRGEKLLDREARLKHKNGSIRHVSISSSAYRENGELVYTRCFTRDITERKEASELLEKLVAERTAQLKETIAQLEAFSYSISHDMRSPLRAMQGYARALLEDYGSQLDPEATDRLMRIQRASTRLDMLIRDVLAYSKVSKGQIQLEPVALGPLLEDLLLNRVEFESLKGCITVEQPLHVVLGHEAYLTQALTNLIGNALKFVVRGTLPKVRIRSEVLGDKVRVWVIDNGVGIHPEHHDRIFQIFGRVYSEAIYEGTGIGLAIVKKALARMGGEVGFRSEPGKGSEFWFTLQKCYHVK